jgi:exodeoxyribonuclease VII small subunit
MAEMKFEDALKRLEKIVEELEGGDLPLEESLSRYEEGIRLSGLCARKLEQAKKKIEMLVKTGDGQYARRPFDASGLEEVAIKKGRTRRSGKKEEGDASLF